MAVGVWWGGRASKCWLNCFPISPGFLAMCKSNLLNRRIGKSDTVNYEANLPSPFPLPIPYLPPSTLTAVVRSRDHVTTFLRRGMGWHCIEWLVIRYSCSIAVPLPYSRFVLVHLQRIANWQRYPIPIPIPFFLCNSHSYSYFHSHSTNPSSYSIRTNFPACRAVRNV